METKDFILQKAFELLLKKGYNAVSVTDIQQVTGMARGLLYHYFGSLDMLYKEAAGKYLTTWMKWDKEETKDKGVKDLITWIIEKYNRTAQEIITSFDEKVTWIEVKLVFLEAIRYHGDLTEIFQSIYKEQFAIWKTALLNSFSRGELRNGLNIESITWHFVYIQEGVLENILKADSLAEEIYVLKRSLLEFYEIIRR